MSHTEKAFSRSAKALQRFLYRKTALMSRSREIQKMSFVPLLFSNNAIICISSRFYCQTIASVICMTDLSASSNQYTLGSGVKPNFLKCNLTFLSAFESLKCLIETNLVSSAKPSIVMQTN